MARHEVLARPCLSSASGNVTNKGTPPNTVTSRMSDECSGGLVGFTTRKKMPGLCDVCGMYKSAWGDPATYLVTLNSKVVIEHLNGQNITVQQVCGMCWDVYNTSQSMEPCECYACYEWQNYQRVFCTKGKGKGKGKGGKGKDAGPAANAPDGPKGPAYVCQPPGGPDPAQFHVPKQTGPPGAAAAGAAEPPFTQDNAGKQAPTGKHAPPQRQQQQQDEPPSSSDQHLPEAAASGSQALPAMSPNMMTVLNAMEKHQETNNLRFTYLEETLARMESKINKHMMTPLGSLGPSSLGQPGSLRSNQQDSSPVAVPAAVAEAGTSTATVPSQSIPESVSTDGVMVADGAAYTGVESQFNLLPDPQAYHS